MATRDGKTARGGGRGWMWMKTPGQEDLERLQQWLQRKGWPMNLWRSRLFRDHILIHVPVDPLNPDTLKPDPALRCWVKHLRIAPSPRGLQLEYFRHTKQWWPLWGAVGSLEELFHHIEEDTEATYPSLVQK